MTVSIYRKYHLNGQEVRENSTGSFTEFCAENALNLN